MKKYEENFLYLDAKASTSFLVLVFITMLTLTSSVPAVAGSHETYEGTFQGASCVHYKKDCPEDDAHIAMEHDFVQLLPDGKHYFLPNLNRAIKARYVAKPVRISGEVKDHEIWVENLDVKKGNEYRTVWSWEKQQELYKGGGG